MGAGITLMVVGAILAFAVRRETPAVDIQTVGAIFLVAGAFVLAHARHGSRRERTVTRVEDPLDGEFDEAYPAASAVVTPHEGHPDLPDPASGRRAVREHVTDREVP